MYGQFRRRGPLGSRGVFPRGEVVDGRLLTVVDRPFTRRLTHVQVLVEFDETVVPQPRAPRLDIHINAGTGPVRTAYLPIARLHDLSRMPGVQRVFPSLRLFPRIDRALSAVGREQIERLRADARGGVLIGIIDSGIDASHSDFRRRLVRLWDQTVHGPGVPGAGYGMEYRNPSEMRQSVDSSGHGTHLAGIAAGGGSGVGGSPGVNPEARLVIVKTGFSEAEVLDGLRYVRDVARELELPAVANLSLGGHAGPHDGRGPLSQGLDALSGPGFVVCAAAGNEGTIPIHAHYDLGARGEAELSVMLQPARWEREPEAHLYGWAEIGPDTNDHLQIKVEAPEIEGSAESTPFHEHLKRETAIYEEPLAGGFVRIVLPPIEDQKQRFLVEILPGARNLPLGPWTLYLRNHSDTRVDLHLWSGRSYDGPAAWLSGEAVDPSCTIGEPGDSRHAITVGAWTTRLDWQSESGLQERPGTTGDVPAFSSRGPLVGRGGRRPRKPDLVAPGEWIVASRSASVRASRDRIVGRRQIALRGTSQAAAFVSGWISLILAANPRIGPDGVRKKLHEMTTLPDGADGNRWGAGHLGLSDPER